MRKRNAMLMAAAALAVGLLSCGLAALPVVDPATARYPGAQLAGAQKLAVYTPPRQAMLVRKSTYQTTDALPPVRAWYVQRLQVLATANVEPPGGNCVWMSRSQRLAIFQYSAQVLICTVPTGTRINLEESVALGL